MEYQANNGHGRSNVAVYGMLLSICLVMGYLENLIPIAVPVPGIKPGFSNIVIIWVLYSMDKVRHNVKCRENTALWVSFR